MKLTARDHAYVYGVIAQATLKIHPEAREVIEESIRIYGRQRGKRMAQTSQYFGNGTLVALDPKGTGCISANDTILSLGDLAVRNTQLLVA